VDVGPYNMARAHLRLSRIYYAQMGFHHPPFVARSAREGEKVCPCVVISLINYIRWWGAESVLTLNKMCNTLCEDVGVVEFTCDVNNINKIFLNMFSDSVLSDLDVMDAFC